MSAQMATMLALFCMGLVAIAALLIDALLVADRPAGELVFVLDPIAARRGEAPRYIWRLRRLQIDHSAGLGRIGCDRHLDMMDSRCWTADKKRIGHALRIVQRGSEAQPELSYRAGGLAAPTKPG